MDNILEIKNVSKKYKDFALNNINISLPYGYIMGFVGPNGSGKTTTIKLIMNLVNKDSGEINIFGKDNIENEIDIKKDIGFVYDDNVYFENMSIIKNAKIIAPFYENWDWDLFNTLLKRFELNPKQQLKKLSKGMKTKFNLCMALCHNARLIIMDEPTSGLDPLIRRELLDILQEYIQKGDRSILFSTHITSDLEMTADYITFINRGKIIISDEYIKVSERYKLIKGNKNIIENENFSKKLIGIKTNKYGFEALIEAPNELDIIESSDLVIEKPRIEDIMYFFEEENKRGVSDV